MSIARAERPLIDTIEGKLQVALSAAQKAGVIICDGFEQAQNVGEKGLGDFFSQVDIDCDTAIQEEILRHDGQTTILSEELSPDASPGDARWIVDPLDSSAGFLFQMSKEMPSTMIGYREGGETQLAVIGFPLTGETFWAIRGQGAFKDGQPIHVADQPDELSKAWVEMNRNGDLRLQSRIFGLLDERLRLPGGAGTATSQAPHSGLAARMASGEKRLSAIVHDNNPTKVKQGPWDVIPAALILEEAGGVVATLEGSRSYDPFKPEPFVMAASKNILDQLISLAAA